MKEVVLNEFIKERIKENIKMFSREELEILKNNKNILLKIYLLGMLDSYSF